MSMESAKAFIERMKTDEDFAKKIMAENNNDDRMELASCEGFTFTKDEIGQYSEELSDTELDNISGGVTLFCQPAALTGYKLVR